MAGPSKMVGDLVVLRVSLTQLESFVAVAEEGSIARACRRVHLSQPPLSRRILALEEELGVQLFQRQARGMSLLPAGQRLLPRARSILSEVDAARLAVVEGATGVPEAGSTTRSRGPNAPRSGPSSSASD